ncbi:MAG: hypothetical protein WC775_05925 [Patescibacteria group bacterium]|jgi:hypothetical protein
MSTEFDFLTTPRRSYPPIPGMKYRRELQPCKDVLLQAKGAAIHRVWLEYLRGAKVQGNEHLIPLLQRLQEFYQIVEHAHIFCTPDQLRDSAQRIHQFLNFQDPPLSTLIDSFQELVAWYAQQIREELFREPNPPLDYYGFYRTKRGLVKICLSNKLLSEISDPKDYARLGSCMDGYNHFSANIDLPDNPTPKQLMRYRRRIAEWFREAQEIVRLHTNDSYLWVNLINYHQQLMHEIRRQPNPLSWVQKLGIEEIPLDAPTQSELREGKAEVPSLDDELTEILRETAIHLGRKKK